MKAYKHFKLKSSEFLSIDHEEDVIYALTKDLTILEIEIKEKEMVERTSLPFFHKKETISSGVGSKLYFRKKNLYLLMSGKLYSLSKTKTSWGIGGLALNAVIEI